MSSRHPLANWLDTRPQTDWGIDDEALTSNSKVRRYDGRAFSPLDTTSSTPLFLAISIHQSIRPFTHPHIHPSNHPFIHPTIHPYIHTCIHTHTQTNKRYIHLHVYIHTYFVVELTFEMLTVCGQQHFFLDSQTDVFVKVSKFLKQKMCSCESVEVSETTENVSTWGKLEPPTFGFAPNALTIWVIRAKHLLSHVFKY